MEAAFACGKDEVKLTVPDGAITYASRFPAPPGPAAEMVLEAVRQPVGARPLGDALRSRREGDVAVVVSDITRPVPYAQFLSALLREVERVGVRREDILLLVATGTHRPSTASERAAMFGQAADRYRVVDHRAGDDAELAQLPGRSWSGMPVRLNRHYVQAGFRLVTGLVEPHFMAGFSGGRKAICPGLCPLDTIRAFHGEAFLSNPLACNASLDGNPLHQEAVSVARVAPPDFSLNVVMDGGRRVVRAFAGDLEAAHGQACDFVSRCACPPVEKEADLVLTSCGGYPLDTTFYQCVKAMVSCMPAVREGGVIVSFGGCSEGIGSPEYAELMKRYSGRWQDCLAVIRNPAVFVRDQWELQMQARPLAKVGQQNLHFVTDGLTADQLSWLSVTGVAARPRRVGTAVQDLLDRLVTDRMLVAVIPEGPYCAPIGLPR
jgi:nickel-dependent lactate racemase